MRGPRLGAGSQPWVLLAALALFLVLQHGAALRAPFFSDDYMFFDKVRGASLLSLFAPRGLAYGWYRPVSRELHFWVFSRLFGLHPLPYHLVSFALWLAVMGLYGALVRRWAGPGCAALAVAGVAALAAWGVPIEWGPGAQELWLLLFGLAFLFLLVIMLHYSLVISSHRDSIRRLAQTIALLERALEEQRLRTA